MKGKPLHLREHPGFCKRASQWRAGLVTTCFPFFTLPQGFAMDRRASMAVFVGTVEKGGGAVAERDGWVQVHLA